MALNQDIRYTRPGPYYNPGGLFDFIKPSRILVNNVNPISGPDGTGEDKDYYINSATGDLFENTKGNWFLIYNFATGGGGGGITNIENESSPGFFKNIIGSTAHFKGLSGSVDQIFVDGADPNTIFISMEDAYKPVSLNLVNNFPLQTGLGSITFDPNGTLGEDQGYNLGSLAVQVPGTIWICQDPVSKAWNKYDASDGVSSVANIGPGVGVFSNLTAGVANLKSIIGESEEINAIDDGNSITLGINNNYKPLTLSNVQNITQGYGSPSGPTVGNDINQGYAKGALFSEVEPAGLTKLWVCRDAAAGAAVWAEISSGGSSVKKDFVMWSSIGGQPQAMPNTNFNDVNFGVDTNPPAYAQLVGSKFTSLFDGIRQVFRRSAVSEEKTYNVTLNLSVKDFAGATTHEGEYIFKMIRKTGVFTVSQSISAFTLPASAINNRSGSLSYNFIYHEPLLATQDYYFQLRGVNNIGLTPQPFNIDYWAVGFQEI